LNVAPDPILATNTAYTLNFGPLNVLGTGTLNVANNGTATGTVTVCPLNDGGAVRTFTKAGTAALPLTAPASSVSVGAQINLTPGTLNSNAANAIPGVIVNQSAGPTFNVGASQPIGALNGTGTTNLNGNTLTIGAINGLGTNLNSTYSGVIANG